jgi:hypothetical protein
VRFAILLLILHTVAGSASARLRCPVGSFVVHSGTRLLGDGPGSYDVVRLTADDRRMRVAVGVTCPPVPARARGRRVTARWPRGRCGLPERVKLKIVFDADCEIVRGNVRRAHARRMEFVAARCAQDGVLSGGAGEECATADACGPGRSCVDCRCVPLVSFARDVQPIFQNCQTVACHEGPTAVGSVDLTPNRAYAELRSRSARAGACGGQALVAPGDPDASVLWKRIGGTECGGSMPLGSSLLPAADLDRIRTWLAQGAPAN